MEITTKYDFSEENSRLLFTGFSRIDSKRQTKVGEVFKRFRHDPTFLRTKKKSYGSRAKVCSYSNLIRLPFDELPTFFSPFNKVINLFKWTQHLFDKFRLTNLSNEKFGNSQKHFIGQYLAILTDRSRTSLGNKRFIIWLYCVLDIIQSGRAGNGQSRGSRQLLHLDRAGSQSRGSISLRLEHARRQPNNNMR